MHSLRRHEEQNLVDNLDRQIGKIKTQDDINEVLGFHDGTVVLHSFVEQYKNLVNNIYSLHPVPVKEADHYLNVAPLSLPARDSSKTQAVLFPPLVGQMEFYRNIQLHDNDSPSRFRILEDKRPPFGDLSPQLLAQIKANPDRFREMFAGQTLVPVFANHIVEEVADRLDLVLNIRERECQLANNKAVLRQNAQKYGYSVPEGFELFEADYEELGNTLKKLREFVVSKVLKEKNTVWIKYPNGSGGDLVIPFKPKELKGNETENDVINIFYDKLLTLAEQVVVASGLTASRDTITQDHLFSVLSKGGLVVEAGLDSDSKNYNLQFAIGKNGKPTLIGFSEQLTSSEGAYEGNLIRPKAEYSDQTKLALSIAMDKLANYIYSEFGTQILVGADVMIEPNGKAYVIDMNARYNGSTTQKVMANYYEAPYSLNRNFKLPIIPTNYSEILSIFGEDLLFSPEKGYGIIPKMPRIGTPIVKCDIIAPNLDSLNLLVSSATEKLTK